MSHFKRQLSVKYAFAHNIIFQTPECLLELKFHSPDTASVSMPPASGCFKFLCQMLIDLMIISDALVSGFHPRAHIYNTQREFLYFCAFSLSVFSAHQGRKPDGPDYEERNSES